MSHSDVRNTMACTLKDQEVPVLAAIVHDQHLAVAFMLPDVLPLRIIFTL